MGIFFAMLMGPVCIISGLLILRSIESQINYTNIVKKAPQFSAEKLNPDAANAPLVALTGTLNIANPLTTETPLIEAPYLFCKATTEVFAWNEEKKETNTTSKLSYTQNWTSAPTPSTSFEEPVGHENPQMHTAFMAWQQPSFTIGAYTAHTSNLQLPEPTQLRLTSKTITVKSPNFLSQQYLYTPKKPGTSAQAPQIGDLRTNFCVIDGNKKQVTIFGRVQGAAIDAANMQDVLTSETNETFFRLFFCSRQEAIKQLDAEYKSGIFFRNLISWFLLCLGFLLILTPIMAITNGIPILSGLINFMAIFFATTCASALFILAKIFIKIITAPLTGIACTTLLLWFAWLLLKKNNDKNMDFEKKTTDI